MAYPVFPDIGPPLIDGFTEDFQKNTISSDTDGGYTITRPGFTRSPGIWVVPYKLSDANYLALMDFYRNTIACGAYPFTWTHPKFRTPHTVRMTDKPAFDLDETGDHWKGNFTLEEV